MDADKLRVLQEVEYRMQPSCGLCIHANLPPLSDWGTCNAIEYHHQKHSDADRKLSIHRNGGCKKFQLDDGVLVALGRFGDFVEMRAGT